MHFLLSMLSHCQLLPHNNLQPRMTICQENWFLNSFTVTSSSHSAIIIIIQNLLFSLWLTILLLYLFVIAIWFARKIQHVRFTASLRLKDRIDVTDHKTTYVTGNLLVNTNDSKEGTSSSTNSSCDSSSPTTQTSETILCYLHPDFYTIPISRTEKMGQFSAQFSIVFNVVTKDKQFEDLITQTDDSASILNFESHTPRNETRLFNHSSCRSNTSRFCVACLRDVLNRYRFPFFLPHAV